MRRTSCRESAISTVVGALIFLMVFLAAVSAVYIIVNSLASYASNVRSFQEREVLRAHERVAVAVFNQSGLACLYLKNESPTLTIAEYAWVNHTAVRLGIPLPPGEPALFNTSIPYEGGAVAKIVTFRGNVFSSSSTFAKALDEIWGGDVYVYDPARRSLTLERSGLIFRDEFDGEALNATAWSTYAFSAGGSAQVAGGQLLLSDAAVINKVSEVGDCVVQYRARAATNFTGQVRLGPMSFARGASPTSDPRGASYVLNASTARTLHEILFTNLTIRLFPPPPEIRYENVTYTITNETRSLALLADGRAIARNSNWGPDNGTWYVFKFTLSGSSLVGDVYYDSSSDLAARVYATDSGRARGWFGLMDEDNSSVSCYDYVRVYSSSKITIRGLEPGSELELISPSMEVLKRVEVTQHVDSITIDCKEIPFPLRNCVVKID